MKTKILPLILVLLLTGCEAVLPWQKSRTELNAIISKDEAQISTLNTAVGKFQTALDANTSAIAGLKNTADKQAAVTQNAAEDVSQIVAVGQLVPPVTRKDKVVDNAATAAATALPKPADMAKSLQVAKDLLDEAKTSNAALAAQHQADLDKITTSNATLAAAKENSDKLSQKADVANAEVQATQTQLADANAALKTANTAWQNSVHFVAMFRNTIAWSLIGLSLAVGALGWLTSNLLTVAKAGACVALSVILLIIPADIYLIGIIVVIVGLLIYALAHHFLIHKALQKTAALTATPVPLTPPKP